MSAPEVLSPEERCERVRMALAEAGYPDVLVRWNSTWGSGAPAIDWLAPLAVMWRAFLVAGENVRCWPCFETAPSVPPDRRADCDHDPLTSPWPEVVR